jgi:adenine phosphoribosyltransferase
MDELKSRIRGVPDFPKPGIFFYDITTLLQDPVGLQLAVEAMTAPHRHQEIDIVVGIESRGFLFGAPIAVALKTGFAPVRKPGKLPFTTEKASYALEYGTDTLEIHSDAVHPGQRVLIVDDLLATGGTVRGTIDLVERLQGKVVGLAFLVELEFLRGRERLQGHRVESVIRY